MAVVQKIVIPVVALVLIAGCAAAPSATLTPAPTVQPTPQWITKVEPPMPMSDFTLTNQSGSPVHLTNLEGKLTLLTFGYTHCPDVCPVNLAHFKQVKEGLGTDSSQVNFVFVSVDARRDTPERLTEYLRMFDSSFIGLTGEEAAVRSVIEEYGGRFNVLDAMGLRKNYAVEHTVLTYLLDQQGRWVRTYAYNIQPDLIVGDIQAILSGA